MTLEADEVKQRNSPTKRTKSGQLLDGSSFPLFPRITMHICCTFVIGIKLAAPEIRRSILLVGRSSRVDRVPSNSFPTPRIATASGASAARGARIRTGWEGRVGRVKNGEAVQSPPSCALREREVEKRLKMSPRRVFCRAGAETGLPERADWTEQNEPPPLTRDWLK